MKKNLIFILAALLTGFSVSAQKNGVKLLSSDKNETIVSFSFEDYRFNKVTTPKGDAYWVSAEDLSQIMLADAPNLPKFTASIIIPEMDIMKIEVVSSKYQDFNNGMLIAPSKGNFTREIDPATVPYKFGKQYEKNEFFPGILAKNDLPYIARDYRGMAVHTYPVQYNPATGIVRIYSEIIVRISSDGQGGANQLTRKHPVLIIERGFNEIYKNHFLNYSQYSKYTPVEENGKMLIVCNDDWMAAMQPLVDWKNKIGRPTEIVSKTTAGGTAANIKTYVQNYYNTNGLTYLLLVGDAAQIPTNSGGDLGGDSDNAYAYVTGADHYQEFFVGRFSAETVAQVNTQVLRTIEYENGDQLADGWLNNVSGIASSQGDGNGDDGESDFVHARNMQIDLLGFTYTTKNELFDGSQGGSDAAGDPTQALVATALNTGTGIITYTGHGADTYWVTSGFSVTNVEALTNHNKLPFIFDVACVNGNFDGQTCFAEAWLRSEDAGDPTGAIAICASTINQSWAPPMNAQDEMVDLLSEIHPTNIKRTFAGVVINGCFLMNDEDGDFDMTDTWTIFGDPSLMIRTADVTQMTVNHATTIVIGSTNFPISCNFNGALACVSFEGNILGTALVAGETANVPISGITPGQVLDVAITGFNKETYLSNVTVISPEGPYIVLDAFSLNGSNTIDYGNSSNISITLKNVGPDDATDVTASLATADPAVTSISNNINISFGTITGNNGISVVSDKFNISVSNDIEDQHVIAFTLTSTDGSDSWVSNFNVIVNAPQLTPGTLTILNDDNADGILDPNETADVKITVSNTGHADITNVIGAIAYIGSDLTINTGLTTATTLAIGETKDFMFNVSANAATAPGTPATIEFDVTGGTPDQYSAAKNFTVIIGFVPEYCEASATTTSYEYISKVVCGTINNSSSSSSYTDYTAISTDVFSGSSCPIVVTVGSPYASDRVICWIDWNYDGIFNETNEKFTLNWTQPTASGNIIIPTDALLRPVTMRIRLYDSSFDTPTSCGNVSYGETEDYKLNIIPGGSYVIEPNRTQFSIYPNPSTGIVTIQLNELNANAFASITNIQGQEILRKKLTQNANQLDLSSFGKGIYFVKVVINQRIEIKKIVIN